MKDFVYLVQGTANLITKYYQLKKRKGIETLFLTYDVEIDGAFFLPNSTWAEGRNFLLNKALEFNESFLYFIFLDDDMTFLRGSFIDFERYLIRYKPAVGVPVFIPKTQNTVLSKRLSTHKPPIFQICRHADAQYLALHADVIKDQIVVPLQTQFDSISWWCTSSTQQLLLFNLYPRHFLQFNYIEVSNDCHREYTNNSFEDIQKKWFDRQFRKSVVDVRHYTFNLISSAQIKYVKKLFSKKELVRLIIVFCKIVWLSLLYNSRPSYRFSEKGIGKILAYDSELYKQYLKSRID